MLQISFLFVLKLIELWVVPICFIFVLILVLYIPIYYKTHISLLKLIYLLFFIN